MRHCAICIQDGYNSDAALELSATIQGGSSYGESLGGRDDRVAELELIVIHTKQGGSSYRESAR